MLRALGATGKTMPLVMFFIFFFPVLTIALLSVPMFLFIKNKTSGAFHWYALNAVVLSNFIGLLFIALLNSLSSKYLGLGLYTILVCSIYGLILGAIFWHLDKKQKVA